VHKTNFFYLFFALMVLLFVVPLADDLHLLGTGISIAISFSLLLLIGIWSLRGGGYFFSIGITFVVAGVILNIMAVALSSALLRFGTILSLMGFLLVAITFTLRQVVVGTEINTNRLVGAVCVFLMMGVIWAFAYSMLELLAPGSFQGVTESPQAAWDSGWLYFSFVTLTTLGYGDILPVSAVARMLAFMQAIAGQFYLAVLVAGLVSAYISQKQAR